MTQATKYKVCRKRRKHHESGSWLLMSSFSIDITREISVWETVSRCRQRHRDSEHVLSSSLKNFWVWEAENVLKSLMRSIRSTLKVRSSEFYWVSQRSGVPHSPWPGLLFLFNIMGGKRFPTHSAQMICEEQYQICVKPDFSTGERAPQQTSA